MSQNDSFFKGAISYIFQCYHCISVCGIVEGSLHVPRQDASMEGKVEKDKLQEALYCNFETLCLENSPIYQATSVLECARLDLMFRRSNARTWCRLVCQCLLSRSARSLYIYKHAYVCFSGLCKCDIRVLPGDPARAYSSSWLRAKGQGMIRNESKRQFFKGAIAYIFNVIIVYLYIYVVLLRAFEGSLHVPRQDASMEGEAEKERL